MATNTQHMYLIYWSITDKEPNVIIVEKITSVANLLLDAAKAGGTAPYYKFHKLFDDKTPDNNKYDTLDAASRALEYPSDVIYSSVLAKKDDNCPGIGFYDIFKNHHRDEFIEIAGHDDEHALTKEEKEAISRAIKN